MISGFSSSVATPGTRQRITSGASPALPTLSGALSGTITPRGNHIVIQVEPGNTAGAYVWIGGSSLSVSGNSGWYAKLSPGSSFTLAEADGHHDLADLFVDTDGTVAKYAVSFTQ